MVCMNIKTIMGLAWLGLVLCVRETRIKKNNIENTVECFFNDFYKITQSKYVILEVFKKPMVF